MKEKSLFKNSIYKAILTIVNIVIPLFIGPYIARVLDINLYGIYNKVYSEIQVFLVFASFGVYNYGIREISKVRNDQAKVEKLFSDLFIFSLITNIISLLIFIIYGLIISNGITTKIYLLVSLQIVANIFYTEFVNEALENYTFITIKGVIVKILYFLLLIIFVKKPEDIIIYALIIGLIVLINNLWSFIYIKKRINFTFKRLELKRYIKPLTSVLIINNISLLYAQLDKLMLGYFNSEVSVTIYYIAYYIISTIASIPSAMVSVSIPRMGYLIANCTKKEYEDVLNQILSSFMMFIIPMSIGMFALSKEIILIYGSEKYEAAIIPFAVMCAFRIIMSIGNALVHLVFYPSNNEKKYIKYSLLCGLLNLLLNSILVVYNILTPAKAFIATGISETLLFILQYIYVKRKMQIDIKIITKKHLKYLITSLAFIPISIIIKMLGFGTLMNTLIIIIMCGLLYLFILYISGDDNYKLIINKLPLGKLKKYLVRKC